MKKQYANSVIDHFFAHLTARFTKVDKEEDTVQTGGSIVVSVWGIKTGRDIRGRVLLWESMMDGPDRLSLSMTDSFTWFSDHHRVLRDRNRTTASRVAFLQASVAAVPSFTHPLSPVSIHTALHPSINIIQSSIIEAVLWWMVKP